MKKSLFFLFVCGFFISNAQVSTATICMVGTDSAGLNNFVIWDKTLYPEADSFIVSREVTSGNFVRIGARSSDSLSIFYDTARSIGPANGNPQTGLYHYKLQVKDTLGQLGAPSYYHNTNFMTDQQNGQFAWYTYLIENTTATPVTTFELQRDSNSTGYWKTIGTTSGTQLVLTDPQYFTFQFTARWRLKANGFNCTPVLRVNENAQSGYMASYSNIVSNVTTGIRSTTDQIIKLYPNPANEIFTIELPGNEKTTAQMFDVHGKLVFDQSIKERSDINVSELHNGVYTVTLKIRGQTINKKLVIIR
ncbi:MAG: T9SS type A sorting domain-containing protein [Bacteroidia bacterium]